MAKRHLSDKQKRMIASRQDQFVSKDSNLSENDVMPGLVVAQRGKQLEVEAEHMTITCHARQNIGSLVVGDRVRFAKEDDGSGVIIAREDRHSVLTRPDPYKQEKIIAANIDQMVVVLAADPEPIWHFLDKYLVAAQLQGFNALIALNKIDLSANLSMIQSVLSYYQGLGYPFYEVSCQSGIGLPKLEQALIDKTSIFVGQSGVGKSSLVNALFGEELAKIGDISEANNKGQHTTTTARLYHFPKGGDLVDSPGIREFGLWHISQEQALRGFKEIYTASAECKFRDCQHRNTKGCAVEAAVAAGNILMTRLHSYFRVVDNLE